MAFRTSSNSGITIDKQDIRWGQMDRDNGVHRHTPSSLDFTWSNSPFSHRVERILDRWCQALKLEKLLSILRVVYLSSDCGGGGDGMVARMYLR